MHFLKLSTQVTYIVNNSYKHILSLIHTFISFVKWLLLANCLQVIPTEIKQFHNSLMSAFAISIEIAWSLFSLPCHNAYQDLCLITKVFFVFPCSCSFLFCYFNHLHILVHGFIMFIQSMLRYYVYHDVLAS